jgi:hypothetical protein
MYWPRFRLTKSEAKRWCVYSAPDKKEKQVLYRVYAGEIQLSTTNKEDTENMQISRRARVFGLTCAGDVHNIEISIFDSAGEQYTMGFIPASLLVLGNVPDFRSINFTNGALATISGVPVNTVGFSSQHVFGMDSAAPHIFEPNIVLDPNQTLSIKGRAMYGLADVPTRADPVLNSRPGTANLAFNIHCWEFPLE